MNNKLQIDIYGRYYDGDERRSISRDYMSIDQAIEYLNHLKEEYKDRV